MKEKKKLSKQERKLVAQKSIERVVKETAKRREAFESKQKEDEKKIEEYKETIKDSKHVDAITLIQGHKPFLGDGMKKILSDFEKKGINVEPLKEMIAMACEHTFQVIIALLKNDKK